MATITSTIGTASRNYSTLQAWADTIPADVVASGNSYLGNAYNDSEFTGSYPSVLDFGAHTCDATHTITLTAAPGQSFQDHPTVRTNPLNYDQTKGVAVRNTGSYTVVINSANSGATAASSYVIITRLQVKSLTANGAALSNGGAGEYFGNLVKDCIVVGNINWSMGDNINVMNILPYVSGYGIASGGVSVVSKCIGCTTVTLFGTSPGTTGFYGKNYLVTSLYSCAAFNFTNPSQAVGSGSFSTSSNNGTEKSTGFPGTANVYNIPFSSSTPFVDGTSDFRPIAGTPLSNAGFLHALAPNDITGTPRSATPTIGCWELASAAPSVEKTETFIIFPM